MASKTIETVSIGIKVDGTNFPIGSKLMRNAFGRVKQEESREGIWKPTAQTPDSGIGSVLGARQPPPQLQFRGIQPLHQSSLAIPPRGNSNDRKGVDKSKLVGSPEWWEDGHKSNKNNTGKGKIAVGREGADGGFFPSGDQVATGAGNDGSRPIGSSAAGGWWGSGGGIEKGEEAARASYTRSIEGKASNPFIFSVFQFAPQEK